jgi:hypothetical protein
MLSSDDGARPPWKLRICRLQSDDPQKARFVDLVLHKLAATWLQDKPPAGRVGAATPTRH